MNRRERKHMEKQMGLDKYYKTMTRAQRFEKMRNNIINGKKLQEDMKKKVSINVNAQDDKKESDTIASNALAISIKQQIPMMEALAIAKEEYDKAKQ